MNRLPVLLDDEMRPRAVLEPLALAIDWTLRPLSRARMCIRRDGPPVPVGSAVRLYYPTGQMAVYIAESVAACGDVREIMLVHGLYTLSEAVVFEAEGGTQRSYAQALSSLLARQTRSGIPLWAAGRCEAEGKTSLRFEKINLLQALLTLGEEAGSDLVWSFDQQTRPWLVHLGQPDTGKGIILTEEELLSLRVTDSAGQATRLYPVGKGGLTVTRVNGGQAWVGESPDAARGVERIYEEPEQTDAAALLAGARREIQRQAGPRLHIRAVLEAAPALLSRLEPGQAVTILRDEGAIRARLTRLIWERAIREPCLVRLEMGSAAPDAVSAMRPGALH